MGVSVRRNFTRQGIIRIAGLYRAQPVPVQQPVRHPDLAERMERVAVLTPERAAVMIREGGQR
jgi:hypothetical protein